MYRDKRRPSLALRLFIIFFVTVIVGFTFPNPGNSSNQEQQKVKKIKIGVVNVLTGPMSQAGTSIANGAKLALDKINAEGGLIINGQKYIIEPLLQDDRGDPKETVSIFLKLIGRGIKFFNGPLPSSCSIAVGPIINKHKVIDINQSLSVEASKWPNTFSTHINGSKTEFVGKYIFQKLGIKKLGLMTANNAFGITLADSHKKGYREAGGQLVTEEFFKMDETDFYAQLTKIKNLEPEGVFVAGWGDACVLIFKQAHELNAAPIIMGESALATADILRLVDKEYVQGMYDFSQIDLGNLVTANDPRAMKFLAEYQEKYGKAAPMGSALFGYDGIVILAQAILRANSVDISKVRDALEGLNPPDNTWKWQPVRRYNEQNGKLFSEGLHKVSLIWALRQFKGDDYVFVDWIGK